MLRSIVAAPRDVGPNATAKTEEEKRLIRDGYGLTAAEIAVVKGVGPVVSATGKSTPLPGDNPIRNRGDDVLERSGRADAFARQVLDLDASEGAAVGVFGPWGSGKTSFLNLARKTFENKRVPVLDFNPWLFSGTEQLVERFFKELSMELKLRDLATIGKALEGYGDALSEFSRKTGIVDWIAALGVAVLGATASGGTLSGLTGGFGTEEIVVAVAVGLIFLLRATMKGVGKGIQRRQGEILNRREKITSTLRKRDKPIVVVLDDVDRLSAPEIREVFRLVRLTASFPNLIYIVSCDRLRVEQALGEQGLSGRDYLEKIIQLPFNLPELPEHLFKQQLFEAIENALAGIQNRGPFDKEIWGEVYRGILRPLIRNMRDVRRFAMAIRDTVGELEGQVAQVDVLALEAVRVFLPDVFRLLPGAIDGLTVTSRPLERELDRMMPQDFADSSSAFNERCKAQVNGLIEAAKKDREREADPTAERVVRAMVSCLFPAGGLLMSDSGSESHTNQDAAKHLTECRVAHEHVLRRYLERVVNPDLLAFHDAERALDRMTDPVARDEFIRSLDPARRQDVISNLCDLVYRIPREHVEPGIVMLLNLWSDMPEHPSGWSIFVNDATRAVRMATRRLLGTLEDTTALEVTARRILPQLTSLSSKVGLVQRLGQQDIAGHSLVSEATANELKMTLRNEILAASAADLAKERDPLPVLIFAKQHGGPPEEPLQLGDSPRLTFALLRSAREETATGSGPVRRSVKLDWECLIDLYGGDEVLKTRIDDLKAGFESLKPWIESRGIPLDEAENLLELANGYLTGRRPEED